MSSPKTASAIEIITALKVVQITEQNRIGSQNLQLLYTALESYGNHIDTTTLVLSSMLEATMCMFLEYDLLRIVTDKNNDIHHHPYAPWLQFIKESDITSILYVAPKIARSPNACKLRRKALIAIMQKNLIEPAMAAFYPAFNEEQIDRHYSGKDDIKGLSKTINNIIMHPPRNQVIAYEHNDLTGYGAIIGKHIEQVAAAPYVVIINDNQSSGSGNTEEETVPEYSEESSSAVDRDPAIDEHAERARPNLSGNAEGEESLQGGDHESDETAKPEASTEEAKREESTQNNGAAVAHIDERSAKDPRTTSRAYEKKEYNKTEKQNTAAKQQQAENQKLKTFADDANRHTYYPPHNARHPGNVNYHNETPETTEHYYENDQHNLQHKHNNTKKTTDSDDTDNDEDTQEKDPKKSADFIQHLAGDKIQASIKPLTVLHEAEIEEALEQDKGMER